jgi:hypothetical protein
MDAPQSNRLAWRPRLLTAACLVICVIFGVWQLSPIFWSEVGNDSRVFYAAATLASRGGNPYDFGQLSVTEAQINAEARSAGSGRDSLSPNEYHYPPVMTRGWQLLAPLGDGWFFVVNSAILLLAGVIGIELILASLQWRDRWLPRLFFVFSLPMLTVLSSGNPASVMLLGWAGALLASRRGRPVLAGAVLAVCWIKPPVGIPIAAALLLFERDQWRRLLEGLVIGSVVFAAINVMAGGFAGTGAWIQSLFDFTASINAQQSSVIQQRFLAGLSAPFFFLGPVAATAIALALAAALLLWAHRRRALRRDAPGALPLALAVLTATALAVAPYIHTYDLVLEAVPVLVLAGLPLTPLNRAVLLLWATAPFLNLGVVLAVALITHRLDVPWSYAAGLNALTLAAVVIAAAHQLRPAIPAGQPAVA